MTTRKKRAIQPNYVKNTQGKTTHVYLTIDDYKVLMDDFQKYDQAKKKEGIRWKKLVSSKKRLR